TVSREHARIAWDPESSAYWVRDEGSASGTLLFRAGRSIEVSRHDRRGVRLETGDEVYLGRAAVRVEIGGPAGACDGTGSPEPSRGIIQRSNLALGERTMPLYEYRCRGCGNQFEVLQRLGEGAEGLACTSCGAAALDKQFSTFATG